MVKMLRILFNNLLAFPTTNNPKFWFVLLSGLIIVQACGPLKTTTLPSSTGKQGEIIVSLEDRYRGSIVEANIRSILGSEPPALPQPEPLFNYSVVPGSSFTGLLKAHRCIVMVETMQETKDGLLIQKNVWAKPQIVIQISGKTPKEIEAILLENKARIQEALLSFELNQLIKKHQVALDKKLQQTIKKSFGVELVIPKGFLLINKQEDFAWIREETPE
ncbi:MAG TPA: DUF4837 family protein, partial [Flavobacteriales bacterium]|nr:DUF4837 family protein [Flavobacteriales bacterium]